MEFKIKKVSYVFWILAVLSVIWAFIAFIYAVDSYRLFDAGYIILFPIFAVPCLFSGIALTLTLVSKALMEISISTMKMLEDQKKNTK